MAKKDTLPADKGEKASVRGGNFPIVGIGASAGGLEAIEGFLSGIPAGVNIAFVIIQHLAPEHKSMMAPLLEKHTALEVVEIKDGMRAAPGFVYLNPPNKDIAIENGALHLEEPAPLHGVRLSIDHFFRSLAHARNDASIGIVLSGTGSDGSLGLRAIKEAGGMAMAQQESQARYDGMPRSAIDTGLVDFVLPVEKMGAELLKYVKHPYIGAPRNSAGPWQRSEDQLQKIFTLVRSATGHDFVHYKRNTTFRRIQRRMAVHQIENMDDYVRYLDENKTEARILFKDFLISVTDFFRDPKAFKALYDKVILPLVDEKPAASGVRVWVAGCATGEEAYSIAILFCEAMQALKKHLDVQIFATDVDADAIDYARRGAYPESIAADMTADRLKYFFIKKDNSYAVKKQVRDMVVFAVQDLIKDPPFSKLDLVCCRNVLIYMDAALQKKIVPLFHYTLRPGGALFLGTSETVGDFGDRFSSLDVKGKIYRRKGTAPAPAPGGRAALLVGPPAVAGGPQAGGPVPSSSRQLAEQLILQNYAPPCVLIDDNFDVLYFHGETERFLKLPEGEPSFNLLKMAPEDLHYKLSSLLHKASSEKTTVVAKGVKIRRRREIMTIDLVLRPLPGQAGKPRLMMVTFEPSGEKSAQGTRKGKGTAAAAKRAAPGVAALEQELQSVKEYLQTTVEELETSNEELKSTNEELQSTNEELQSSNEELDTSREELQSANEELSTVNTEMQGRMEDLLDVNNDLGNVLSSARAGAVFLDNDLKIRRFTPSAKKIFKLIETDMGRPVADIAHGLKYDTLTEDMAGVLRDLAPVEKEVETRDGTWVSVRIMPYRSAENAVDGVALTFLDITEQKKASMEARKAVEFAESIFETVREPLVVLDGKLRIISANGAFYEKFDLKPLETGTRFIYEINEGFWDVPGLKDLLQKILPGKSSFQDFRVEKESAGRGRQTLLLNARQVFYAGKGMDAILLAIEERAG